MPERGWSAWLAILLAAVVCWLGLEAQRPPRALGFDAPSQVFSAVRAMRIVEAIAQRPHPSGTPEAERVRGVVMQELKQLGLETETQTFDAMGVPGVNVLARLKGTGPKGKKALMLCAHSDSVPSGPGAGDDASGVAVVLETLRAIQAGPPLARDVIVLIDDAEERGLLGAYPFAREHPWADDVGVVLNFEARGVSGPSFMFETSEHNGWLIEQFARAAPHPLATSVSMDVYRIMPNDTDLSVFKAQGMAGLNFAFGGGMAAYHTPDDAPANLSLSTLQHQGENALAMTRRLGQLDLDATQADDVIYTSILGRWVLAYPVRFAVPIAELMAGLFLAAFGLYVGLRRIRFSDLAVGIGIWPAALFGSVIWVALLMVAIREICAGVGFYRLELIDVPLMALFACVSVAITLFLERLCAQTRPLRALSLGALFWWLVLALASAFWMPGASYLMAWPALGVLLGLLLTLPMRPGSPAAWLVTFVSALPALVLMPPIIRNLFDGLGVRLAAPSQFVVVLFVGVMLPLLGPLVVPRRRERPHPYSAPATRGEPFQG